MRNILNRVFTGAAMVFAAAAMMALAGCGGTGSNGARTGGTVSGVADTTGTNDGGSTEDTGKIVTWPVPNGIYYAMHNDDFTVRVRPKGGDWIDLYEYNVIVDMDTKSEATMAGFDFSGEVEVMVKKNNGELNKVEIRPIAKNIRYRRKGNIVTFKLDEPCNLSVEFNGDKLHNLHLFTNPIETDAPSPDDPGVIYFGEGVHEPEEGQEGFVIPSDTRVYLAPGAVVKGTLICDNVENVRIEGRGMLLNPQRGIQIEYSKNVTIEDIIIVDPRHYSVFGGQSEGLTISNIRSFSCQGWSDGIDMMSCSDVHVDGVFMRNSDDCIAVYGPRWDYRGDARNILVENSTLWADIAHPINMGLHGYTGDGVGSVIEGITFRNIDILEHDEDDPPYEGCMAICCGDMNLIRDILYEDIRIERVEEGQIFHFEVVYNEKYCSAPGRGIEGVTLRNISCADIPDLHPSSIEGYDSDRMIRNVSFENVRIGRRKILSLDGIRTNPYIDGITFE